MGLKILCALCFFAAQVMAGEAAFFSPDCRDCETAAHSGGARVGNDVGVQVGPTTAVPPAPANPPPVPPAPVRQ